MTGDFEDMQNYPERRLNSGANTVPPIGSLRLSPRHVEPESIPVGSTVRLPSGKLATVLCMRGHREKGSLEGRDHRVRLVCQYLTPVHRDEAVVQMLPELLTVVSLPCTPQHQRDKTHKPC